MGRLWKRLKATSRLAGVSVGAAGDGKDPAPGTGSAPIDRSVLRESVGRWEYALESTLRSSVIPYGYTVTIWSSGALLIHIQGTPGTLEAIMFVAGALLAFAVLASISSRLTAVAPTHTVQERVMEPVAHPIFTAGLHIVAVGLALGAASVVDHNAGQLAWILGSFTATAIYLAAASAELAVALEMSHRDLRISDALTGGRRRRQEPNSPRRRASDELSGGHSAPRQAGSGGAAKVPPATVQEPPSN